MEEEGIFWKPLSGQIAQRLEACLTPKGSSRTSFWSRLSNEHLTGKAGGIERANWESVLKLHMIFIGCLLFKGAGKRLVEYFLYLLHTSGPLGPPSLDIGIFS